MGRGGQVGGQRGQQLKVRLQSRHSLHHCGVVATPSDLEVLPGSPAVPSPFVIQLKAVVNPWLAKPPTCPTNALYAKVSLVR